MKINITKLLAPAALLGSLLFSTVAMAQGQSCAVNGQQTGYYNQTVNYRNAYYQQKRSISERFQNQKVRIVEGIRDGSLSGREADLLRHRQVALESEFAATGRVGYMTPAQYAHFNAELDQMSQIIYNTKHNAINRYNDNGYGARPYNSNNSYQRPVSRTYGYNR
jgi:hypothetical protein